MAIFAVQTFVLSSHGKTEFSIQKFTSFSECKGTKYTWEYRRLCQLNARCSHLSIFNRESRWQLVFFTNMSYTSSISMTPRFTGSSYSACSNVESMINDEAVFYRVIFFRHSHLRLFDFAAKRESNESCYGPCFRASSNIK